MVSLELGRYVVHALLIPVVMSATGSLATEATTFYRRLASFLASKLGDEYCIGVVVVQPLFLASMHGISSFIGHFYQSLPSLDLIQMEFNLVTTISDV